MKRSQEVQIESWHPCDATIGHRAAQRHYLLNVYQTALRADPCGESRQLHK